MLNTILICTIINGVFCGAALYTYEKGCNPIVALMAYAVIACGIFVILLGLESFVSFIFKTEINMSVVLALTACQIPLTWRSNNENN